MDAKWFNVCFLISAVLMPWFDGHAIDMPKTEIMTKAADMLDSIGGIDALKGAAGKASNLAGSVKSGGKSTSNGASTAAGSLSEKAANLTNSIKAAAVGVAVKNALSNTASQSDGSSITEDMMSSAGQAIVTSTSQMLQAVDKSVKIDSNLVKATASSNNQADLKKSPKDTLTPLTKAGSELLAKIGGSDTINRLYEGIKAIPEGKTVSQVEAILGNPDLKDSGSALKRFKSMDLNELSSLTFSFTSSETKRVATQVLSGSKDFKEPVRIVELVASGDKEGAAAARLACSETVNKLISPEGIANTFGDTVMNKITDRKSSDKSCLSSISYVLTQNGYSRSDLNKINATLEKTMDTAMERAAEGRFDDASDKVTEYQRKVSQLQVNALYILDNLDPTEVEKFARRIDEAERKPSVIHEKALETAEDMKEHKVLEAVASGNKSATLAASNAMGESASLKAQEAIASKLAAMLGIKDAQTKERLSQMVGSSPQFNALMDSALSASRASLQKAAEASARGDHDEAARHIAEANSHITALHHPDNHSAVINGLISDYASSTLKNNDKTKDTKNAPTSLLSISFDPPKDKAISVRTSDVSNAHANFDPHVAEHEVYGMHENVLHENYHMINAAKHNNKQPEYYYKK